MGTISNTVSDEETIKTMTWGRACVAFESMLASRALFEYLESSDKSPDMNAHLKPNPVECESNRGVKDLSKRQRKALRKMGRLHVQKPRRARAARGRYVYREPRTAEEAAKRV